MSKPEQELLAKYLLQQLISRDSDPELDPVVARLARADLVASGDLASEQSQAHATIVPAPPGLNSAPEARSEDSDLCECSGCQSASKLASMLIGFVNVRPKVGSIETMVWTPLTTDH